ncbi:MAG: glycosyltransferase family A protein [Bacteriovorax sp.]|jgi:glycosyltransferase involved in cell wall biosynthesis
MNKIGFTISVLIPTYKRPLKLEKCLECISKQVREPDEVIVVVRPEDLASIEVINLFKVKMACLKIVFSHEAGVICAENAGLKVISNDLVAFIDDDGYAPEDWLLKIENFFSEHPEASAVGGSDIILSEPWTYHDYPVEKVGLISWYGRIDGNHHRKSLGGMRRVQVLKGVNMIFKRRAFSLLDENLAGRDGKLGNGSQWELDLCLSVLNKNNSIYFMPDLVVQHDSDHRSHDVAIATKNNTHNLSYVMLKNLPVAKKISFLIYAIFIGNSQLPGVLKGILDLTKKPDAQTFKLFIYKNIGFWLGVQTYTRWLFRKTV